jgi:ribosomal peptide maturation radical SAM protein 1
MNVLFVNMPFGMIRPAIGVSLLKGHLQQIGVPSRVLYLNIGFSNLAGAVDFGYIAAAPPESLAGDWVFSQCLFSQRDEADAAYLEAYIQRGMYLQEHFERAPMVTQGGSATAPLTHARALAKEFLDDSFERIDWQSYDVVGFTSTFAQHVASLALAKRIKQRFPHLWTVFGGANCEGEMGLQLHRSFPFVDFVCIGEADLTFPRLIEALRDQNEVVQIPGLICRLHGHSHYSSLIPERVKDLNTLPYPDYADFFEQVVDLKPSSSRSTAVQDFAGPSVEQVGVLMESSRGCWWGEKQHCTFCGLNGTSMTFRSKSATRVLDEITYLCNRYKARFVEMVDNILDMHYFTDLLPELQKRRLQLGLFYETKANLSKEQVRQLRDAGIASIQPGIESLSTNVLRLMRKGTSAMQNVQLLKWCQELGLKPFWNLLWGFPGENPSDYEAIAKAMDWLHHLPPPSSFGNIRLDRFSPNFVSAAQVGLSNIRPDHSYQYVYDLSAEELKNLAYYFEHDYSDGRDPKTYVRETARAIARWKKASPNRGLVYADHGDKMAIWDFRSGDEPALTTLAGHERDIYLHCDQNRSLQQIKFRVSDWEIADSELEAFLERIIAKKLMLTLDGRYLSLAVPASKMHQSLLRFALQASRRETSMTAPIAH